MLADPAFAFFCQLHLGSGRGSHHLINTTSKATVVAHDGSWAETTHSSEREPFLVTFDGTHNWLFNRAELLREACSGVVSTVERRSA
ncbi:MAG: hypothetical protein ACRDRX_19575 [Pseudonocardiaceae bacterium]